MANQRGIVAGWDTANSRPKGVTPASDMRSSLSMVADHEGIVYNPSLVFTRSSTAMKVSFTKFVAVIKSALGGWLTPTIDAGSVTLPVGHASYGRWCTFWVRQWDYQTDASHPDSEVETGLLQGTPSASPVKPTVPNGAIAAFSVLVPRGALAASDIPEANIDRASWVTPVGGVVDTGLGLQIWNGSAWTKTSLDFGVLKGNSNVLAGVSTANLKTVLLFGTDTKAANAASRVAVNFPKTVSCVYTVLASPAGNDGAISFKNPDPDTCTTSGFTLSCFTRTGWLENGSPVRVNWIAVVGMPA